MTVSTDILNKLQPVAVVQDHDSHWYVIPVYMQEQFRALLERGIEDEYEQFNDIFANYATGGNVNLIQLYAAIDID